MLSYCREYGLKATNLYFKGVKFQQKNRVTEPNHYVYCPAWLGRRFVKITFSQQDGDPIIDVEEIRNLIDDDIEEADHE